MTTDLCAACGEPGGVVHRAGEPCESGMTGWHCHHVIVLPPDEPAATEGA